jgi:hypothetical protein
MNLELGAFSKGTEHAKQRGLVKKRTFMVGYSKFKIKRNLFRVIIVLSIARRKGLGARKSLKTRAGRTAVIKQTTFAQ